MTDRADAEPPSSEHTTDGAPAPAPEAIPADPLAPAIAAMDRGDLVTARRLATAIARGRAGEAGAADADDGPATEVRARATALLGQLAPDRAIVGVMTFTGLLGGLLAVLYALGRLP